MPPAFLFEDRFHSLAYFDLLPIGLFREVGKVERASLSPGKGDRAVALSFGGLIFSFEAFCSKIGEAGSDLFEMLIVVEQ
jgi:hypothetical protein